MEKWAKIPNSNYSVSNLGAVRFDGFNKEYVDRRGYKTRHSFRPRLLKISHPKDHHYASAHITIEGKRAQKAIHTLVLEAFVGLCPKGMCARHLDGDKTNNALSNLRWGTYKQNSEDKRKHGTHVEGEACLYAKLTSEQVLKIRERVKNGEVQRKLAKEYRVGPNQISRIVRGLRWKHLPLI